MPTSKKPRKSKPSRAAPPRKSRAEALMDDLSLAMDHGDLDAFDHSHAELRLLAVHDPSLDAALFDDITRSRAELAGSIAIAADVEAALWVGDLARVQSLESANLTPGDPNADADADAAQDDDPDLDIYFAGMDPFADLSAGKPGALDALLSAAPDLNSPSGPDERPALFAAVEAPGRSATTLQRLIAAGARPDATLPDGNALIAWALMYDHYDTVTPDSEQALFDLMIAQGVPVNGPSGDFGHNLIAAIIMGGAPQVAALLRGGADPTVMAPDDFQLTNLAGATALMLAAPKPDVLTLLLDHGADPAQRDENGRSPREFISDAATMARSRANDAWGQAHATALEHSLALIRAALTRTQTEAQ